MLTRNVRTGGNIGNRKGIRQIKKGLKTHRTNGKLNSISRQNHGQNLILSHNVRQSITLLNL